MKMKFRTKYSEPLKIFSCSGDRFAPEYKLVIDDEGRMDLAAKGKVDTYAEIQSHKDSCDIHVMMKFFEQTGDDSILNKVQGTYADITEFPKTYAEMLQSVIDGTEMFKELPPEIKEKFNNNPYEFFAAIGTDKFAEVFPRKVNEDVNNAAEPASESVPPSSDSVE